MKKLTTEEFIKRSTLKHKGFFSYKNTDYKNQNTKVKITCPEHGDFEQRPDHHLSGRGCKRCSSSYKKNDKKRIKIFEEFIKKSKKQHKNKYDYSFVNYETAKTKIEIICPKHGVFKQTPDNHLKHGCRKCSEEKNSEKQKSNTYDFIKKAKKIHGDKYDYSKVKYEGNRKKIEIICKEHGSWFQTPYNHIQNKGCRHCSNKSKGEIEVELALIERMINFTREKTFKKCLNPKTKGHLRFDFYLPEYNLCIEYDGRQHFESIEIWGGEKALKEIKIRDKIKNEYCKNNNIRLIRISYKERKNIKKIIRDL